MSIEKDIELEHYILAHSDEEPDWLKQISRDAHVNLLKPRMLSGHLQGRILKMLCRLVQPKYVLEIGTYTGYATLCLAEGSPNEAEVHTIEINDELENFIHKQFARTPLSKKVKLHIGNAMEIIPTLDIQFDLVFIDADKRLYKEYYDLVFPKVRSGGLIIADNTLWDGKILQPTKASDKQTIGISRFNDEMGADSRVEKVIIPLRDGLTVAFKK